MSIKIKTYFIIFLIIIPIPIFSFGSAIDKKVESLVVKGSKKEALDLLIVEFQKTKKNKLKEQLKDKIKQVAEMFLTEDGLKDYESSRSYFLQKNENSTVLIKKSIELEPENTLAIKHYAKILLFNKKCNQAIEQLMLALKLNPFDETLKVFLGQANYCQYGEVRLDKGIVSQHVELAALDLQDKLKNKEIDLVKNLEALIKTYPSYPRLYYYKWSNLDAESKSERERLAKKYIALCREKDVQNQFLDVNPCDQMNVMSSYYEGVVKQSKQNQEGE
ncbi:MAG: hypothetical protein KDD50_10500 [Bdellovibrionales bacterium]|nr:hypothetical protein [Bdellovibrionales bacterium]